MGNPSLPGFLQSGISSQYVHKERLHAKPNVFSIRLTSCTLCPQIGPHPRISPNGGHSIFTEKPLFLRNYQSCRANHCSVADRASCISIIYTLVYILFIFIGNMTVFTILKFLSTFISKFLYLSPFSINFSITKLFEDCLSFW